MLLSYNQWAAIREAFDPRNDDSAEDDFNQFIKPPARRRPAQPAVRNMDMARAFVREFQLQHPDEWDRISDGLTLQKILHDLQRLGPTGLYRQWLAASPRMRPAHSYRRILNDKPVTTERPRRAAGGTPHSTDGPATRDIRRWYEQRGSLGNAGKAKITKGNS